MSFLLYAVLGAIFWIGGLSIIRVVYNYIRILTTKAERCGYCEHFCLTTFIDVGKHDDIFDESRTKENLDFNSFWLRSGYCFGRDKKWVAEYDNCVLFEKANSRKLMHKLVSETRLRIQSAIDVTDYEGV